MYIGVINKAGYHKTTNRAFLTPTAKHKVNTACKITENYVYDPGINQRLRIRVKSDRFVYL